MRKYPPRFQSIWAGFPICTGAHLKNKSLDGLLEVLDDSKKELFEEYCDAQSDMDSISRYDTFTYALKLGILLMVEVFMDSGNGGNPEKLTDK